MPAWTKPSALSCPTRSLASPSMESLVPKCRHPVGQAFTQAGSSPTVVRSTQSVHLDIFPVFSEKRGTLKGHPSSHSWHPMHCSGFTSTMPLLYWTIAPGAGQALRQPGSAQCMHWSFRRSQAKLPSTSVSSKRIRFQNEACSEGRVWYVPTCRVGTLGRSFHSWQATSQALHPMQVEVSMYLLRNG